MSITSFFTPGLGVLTAFGDSLNNGIEFSRDAAGKILVNDGAVSINGSPTVANTSLIQAFGLAGDDVISLNETNGALPKANLFGGSGDDTLTGGSGNDLLFGQADNDTLFGKGGNDSLFGGSGDDVLTGGDGDDQMFGEAGDDRMIWNPGDDNDLMEGGAGIDTAETNGGNGTETFTVTANGARVRVDRVDPAPFSLDIGTTENVVINANGGDDTITASGNLAALVKLTIDGGAGNDHIAGGNGADTLLGGDGNDFIDGNQGNDVAFLGAGDDLFQWDPGDGSDVVEGQDGTDTMLFNGNGANENFDMSANGERLRFFRDVGNITMDTNELEIVDLKALGGTDAINVGDLSGTAVKDVRIDLAGTIGGTEGDAQVDTITTAATSYDDTIDVAGTAAEITVSGLAAGVRIQHSEAGDSLTVNALDGNDTMNASTLDAAAIKLVMDGGAGDDRILGGRGADVLIGGEGNDFIDGNQGNDTAFMGAGDDLFQWDPGDGSDVVEGQDGYDTMLFNGAGASEIFDLSANGERLRFFRDVGNITMDTNDLERVDVKALGGTDTVNVGDLTGTDVTAVYVDLATDALQDNVNVAGSANDDQIVVAATAEGVEVRGLSAQTSITGLDVDGSDRLEVSGGAGADVIDASGIDAGLVTLSMRGGDGNDLFIGSQGNDFIDGQRGDDVAYMGAGDDTFVWNPGDGSDTIEGQDGTDTLLFNGANVAENIDISANGERVRFFRDVANINMDSNDVERIEFNALGGADNIVVNDLSGTDVSEVAISLAATGGAGDGQTDNVTATGTGGDDVAVVFGSGSNLQIAGLAAQISIAGAEGGIDTAIITALAGDDVIDASGVDASAMRLVLEGGDGDDVIVGSAGADVLRGGAGDDVLIGNTGNDVFEGGDGDDLIIVGSGDSEINGFLVGAGSEDRIDVSQFGLDFDGLLAHASQVNGDVLFDLGTSHITLHDVGLSALHQDDFLV